MQPFIGFIFHVVSVNFNTNEWLIKSASNVNQWPKMVTFLNRPWKILLPLNGMAVHLKSLLTKTQLITTFYKKIQAYLVQRNYP